MIQKRRTQERGENQSFHVKQKSVREQKEGESYRQRSRVQVVAGIRPVMEAIEGEVQIDKILIQNGLDGQLIRELRSKIATKGIQIQYVPIEKLNRMTGSNHQGVVATISPIRYHDFITLMSEEIEAGKSPFIVLLDHVTDVRNMGAIVRTAECAGVDAVVVPATGSAQINEDAIKASSGALLRMPICREANLKTVLNFAHQSGLQVVAATEKGQKDYLSVDFRLPTLLIMGAEDTGVSNELLRMSDHQAKLPICGDIQSLNVSVAAGIFMYEMVRQRKE